MNPFQGLYKVGLNIDRALTQSVRLSHPVLSVGNIAVGGRAKTPMVIELCKFFRAEGFQPVVLTRGYGRKSKKDLWLLPSDDSLERYTSDEAGDEALEIFMQSRVPVLVSADRCAQAQKYSEQYQGKRLIFILDDGFQHWKLERDFDLVLVDPDDLKGSLLPTGRLREDPAALKRAHLVLSLGRDVKKKMQVALAAKNLDPSTCVAITTRAGSQKSYYRDLSHELGFSINGVSCSDHLQAKSLQEKIYALPAGLKEIVVGMKEAVKLLPPAAFQQAPQGTYPLQIKDRAFELYIVGLELEWDAAALKRRLVEKGILA